jgi:hypothetical protein
MDIYNKIYNFCKVREDKTTSHNRYKFIINLLQELNIDYKIITGKRGGYNFTNIYVPGDSDKFLSAHYDIINKRSDNANDNTASVINAIAYKLKNKDINLLILDGEEPPYFGAGSDIMSEYIKENKIKVRWILNLELTGFGKYFFIDDYNTRLSDHLKNLYKTDLVIIDTPFNDSTIFRSNGLESNVLTTFDMINESMDISHLSNCHSTLDSLSTIKIDDMKSFVENTLHNICK